VTTGGVQPMRNITLTDQELAAVVAALRNWQVDAMNEHDLGQAFNAPLDEDRIDALCARLENAAEVKEAILLRAARAVDASVDPEATADARAHPQGAQLAGWMMGLAKDYARLVDALESAGFEYVGVGRHPKWRQLAQHEALLALRVM